MGASTSVKFFGNLAPRWPVTVPGSARQHGPPACLHGADKGEKRRKAWPGAPASARPVATALPAIGVSAPVVTLPAAANLALPVPADPTSPAGTRAGRQYAENVVVFASEA